MLKQNFRLFIYLLSLMLMSPIFAHSVHHYTLKNGLKVFVKVDRRAPVVISQIWYKVGSSYEPPGITGISHALEHMMFQGTPKYPKGKLFSIVSLNGGQQNAATSYDFTFYYQELPADKLALSFKLESDRMTHLSLNPKDFAKEIKVVKEERRLRTENNPQALAFEHFAAKAYINNYQHPIIGSMHDINQLNVKKLRRWYQQWYAPNNAVLVVIGNVQPDTVYQLAKKYFGKIPAQKLSDKKFTIEKAIPGKRVLNIKLHAKVPLILMGYNTPSLTHLKNPKTAYALLALSGILDAGQSARVPKEIIRNQQIASSANVYYNPFSRLNGLFMFAGIPNSKHSPKQLINAFEKEIHKLQTTRVSKSELDRIKTQIVANKMYAKDSLTEQATEIGSLESAGLSWKISENFVKNMLAVTPKEIQQAAKKYLTPNRLTIGILEPIQEKGHQHEIH